MHKSFTKSGFLYYELTLIRNKPGLVINSDKQIYSEFFNSYDLRDEYIETLTNKLEELGVTLFNIPLTAVNVNLNNLLSVKIVDNIIVLEFPWNNSKNLKYTNKEDLIFAYNEIVSNLAIISSSDSSGTGTSDYNKLVNKPSVNGVELRGNKSLEDLGVADSSSLDSLTATVGEIRTELTQLHNDFDAIDGGEIGDKVDDDVVVHRKGVSYEQVDGDKDLLGTINLTKDIPLSDNSKRAVNSEYVNGKIEELKATAGVGVTTNDIDSKIVEHNLSNQSHNDIRNSLKDVADDVALKADSSTVDDIQSNLTTAIEDISFLQTDMAAFVGVSQDAALKSKDNEFTGLNTFSNNVAFNNSQIHLTNGSSIKDGVNDKAILNTITVDNNTQQTYLGNDKVWVKGPSGILIEADNIQTKRLDSDGTWKDYVNIDSGNISNYIPANSGGGSTVAVDDKYGIKADYATHYGILDCPNGLIDYSPLNKRITVNPGIVLLAAGNNGMKTTIASAINYDVESTGKIVLFYAQGELLEAGDVFYQEEEPDNGTTSYLAWYKPSLGKWQFKSNATGNVFREAIATPIANLNVNDTDITSINYIGYRILDDDVLAQMSDIESLQDSIEAINNNITDLNNSVVTSVNGSTGNVVVDSIKSSSDSKLYKLWVGSQEQYNSLTVKDPYTIYYSQEGDDPLSVQDSINSTFKSYSEISDLVDFSTLEQDKTYKCVIGSAVSFVLPTVLDKTHTHSIKVWANITDGGSIQSFGTNKSFDSEQLTIEVGQSYAIDYTYNPSLDSWVYSIKKIYTF